MGNWKGQEGEDGALKGKEKGETRERKGSEVEKNVKNTFVYFYYFSKNEWEQQKWQ